MLMLVHVDLQDGRLEFITAGACRSFEYVYVIFSIKRGCAVMGVLIKVKCIRSVY
jgi:hypothetical protein